MRLHVWALTLGIAFVATSARAQSSGNSPVIEHPTVQRPQVTRPTVNRPSHTQVTTTRVDVPQVSVSGVTRIQVNVERPNVPTVAIQHPSSSLTVHTEKPFEANGQSGSFGSTRTTWQLTKELTVAPTQKAQPLEYPRKPVTMWTTPAIKPTEADDQETFSDDE